jgi:hypothetical protein
VRVRIGLESTRNIARMEGTDSTSIPNNLSEFNLKVSVPAARLLIMEIILSGSATTRS